MELVNVNGIFIMILVIYLFMGIIIFFMPTFRIIYLNILINKNDFEKFTKTVDMYIRKSKSEKRKNIYKLKKINAMMELRKWNGIENEIDLLEIDFSNYSIVMLCNTILNLYILNRIEEGRAIFEKIQMKLNQQKEKIRNNIAIRICDAINNYYNNDFTKSRNELQELLKEEINLGKANFYKKNFKANIYFYLGLISKHENEIIKCKSYLENAISTFYPQQYTLVMKATEIIDEISKEKQNE
ncbi:hypothetical protein B0P06_001719 [Clostridium saccharoperbutylacetonicum]|uniref:Uncharacterized protein n=1 Tax=Clostridium saccharoperbutylacetonicum N1-4(HMT) TaxID=931276 RepID=M1MRK8_9CLOT|nr:hypothetical protein [Clostridium saccharoperbutylacetonicum]AGF54217.1 hypothetical protein Cspa_c03990 [Clostridium saccharoperbutylacetonicum N1-4(HMT)]NRT59269.1 hypothetical protein [Clostridium saccharoperbutylacetonicum]NSB28459.1 hypothetical protein [Clostridium saccharoperbutylacetonicum]NSB41948.1 hypothetical protein [Clostridium saccharoperbutylacetonicum]